MMLLVFAEQCLGQDLDRVDPIMGGQQGNDKVLHDAWRCVDLVLKTTCSQVRLPVQIPVTNSCLRARNQSRYVGLVSDTASQCV